MIALCNVDRTQLDRAAKLVAESAGEDRPPGARAETLRGLPQAAGDREVARRGVGGHRLAMACAVVRGLHEGRQARVLRKTAGAKIAEARELIELAPQCKVATQHGTQGGSSKAFRRSIEIIQAGLLGQVRQVHMWCDGYGRFPASHDRPPGEDPVPAGLNWDFWLGPSPWRPFKQGAYHPGCLKFQNWFDLCNGMLAGQGYTFYLPVRALNLEHPTRVEAEVWEPVKETYVSRSSYRFEFPARGDMAPVTVWWMDGEKYPPEEVTEGVRAISGTLPKFGCLFVGDKGELYAGGWGESGVMKLKGTKVEARRAGPCGGQAPAGDTAPRGRQSHDRMATGVQGRPPHIHGFRDRRPGRRRVPRRACCRCASAGRSSGTA